MTIKNNTAIIDRKLNEDGYMAIKCLVNKLIEPYYKFKKQEEQNNE